MLIIQISDMHVKAPGVLYKDKVDTHAYMARAVKHILEFTPQPDVVLATGDLVDAGSVEEYTALRNLLDPLPMPVYLITGNHDERGALLEVFDGHAYLPKDQATLHYVIEDHPIRIVGLDSLIPGEVGGPCHHKDGAGSGLQQLRGAPRHVVIPDVNKAVRHGVKSRVTGGFKVPGNDGSVALAPRGDVALHGRNQVRFILKGGLEEKHLLLG